MRLSREDQKRRDLADAMRALGPGGIIGQVQQLPIAQLKPFGKNARTHSDKQIEKIARSLQAFGFINPVLVDGNNAIVAGHGRATAARRLGLVHIPVLRIEGLTPDQLRAYRLADNRLAELAGWDAEIVAIELQHLMDVELDFNIEAIGWDMPEIDIMLDGLQKDEGQDAADDVPALQSVAVSRPGDLWLLGRHRVLCGSALDPLAYDRLMQGNSAVMVSQDPPWNIAVNAISGRGKTKHREFVMASGEMSDIEFRQFLQDQIRCNIAHAVPGAVIEIFIDWRGVEKVIAAATTEGLELVNICVWVKTNGGMGSLFRSQHEMVVVLKKPGAPVKNNVQLGRFGRYRTNVWTVPGQNSFGAERMAALKSHPTSKPVQLIAEAIRDVTDIGDIVLDSFLGSGSAVVAAERTGRIAYGMELDPLYVDTIVRRWEKFTGAEALLDGCRRSFAHITAERESGADRAPVKRPVRTRIRASGEGRAQ